MRRVLCIAAVVGAALAQDAKEQPVALVIRSEGGSLVRAGNELGLGARAGDILFTGDSLRSGSGSVTFLFCPENAQYALPAGVEVTMAAKQVQVRSGQLGNRSAVPRCVLPQMERRIAASQQHTGASVTRALAPDAEAGSFEQRLSKLPQERRAALEVELAEIDKAIAANPNDAAARITRAGVLENYGLSADAAAEYQRAEKLWPEAVWLKSRLFTLEEDAAKAAAPGGGEPAEPGKTYALLVGISSYQSPDIRPLNFAHEDAALMSQYLRSERGGQVPDEQIVLLTNEKATTAAIRNSFEAFLKGQAKKNDTVILLIATHGTVIEAKGKRGAYIITHDSNPQDLEATALAMGDVQKLIREDLSSVGRVLAFVDVCRSGTIGTIPRNTKVNSVVERLAESEGQMFLFTASRSNEYSFEGPQYGGGHGAFSFFLLEALNGGADLNSDGSIVINELIEYTQQKVAEGTADRQHPRENGTYEGSSAMANNKLQGIAMKRFTPTEGGDRMAMLTTTESRSLERTPTPGVKPVRALVLRERVDFEEALDGGRILPDAPRNAFTALRQFQRTVKPPEYVAQATRLKTALEEKGQQVILQYLDGDARPQNRTEFAAGAAFFGAARLLTPESLLLESRETFCLGRMRIFDKDYQGAQALLERAIRLDPDGAYAYNALGIAELEQANFERAARAFREAAKRAPYWAYPLHNLALTYTQMGNYSEAIRTYQEAMRLAPRYAYLPYNLGLVYQQLNRRREAEAAYKRASELEPDNAMPLNALGYLFAAAGKRRDAERYYREAIAKAPHMPAARHNLAVHLAERRETAPEAVKLWRENLEKSADHLPSRLSLARVLAEQGDVAQAMAEYAVILKGKPDYAAARIAMAGLQAKSGLSAEALANLRETVKQQPSNAGAWEQIGDLEKAAGRTPEAQAAYQKAVELTQDGSTKKRVRRKM